MSSSPNSAYQSAKQLKKEKQFAEEKHASEDRKRKATITSLQQQKKQKLAELKAEAAAIDSKIASLEAGNRYLLPSPTGKVREKSENLMWSGKWSPCLVCSGVTQLHLKVFNAIQV